MKPSCISSYPEIKDLLKHFLTLISATLVFSVTFSEKVIDYQRTGKTQKRRVFGAWLLLVATLGSCGLGIYLNYLTAEAALTALAGNPGQFERLEASSYMFQDLAALLYGLGLLVLVVSAIAKRGRMKSNKSQLNDDLLGAQ